MKRLKVQTIVELLKRIDCWCEVLEFITNSNNKNAFPINQLIYKDLDEYKKWLNDNDKKTEKEMFDLLETYYH